MGRQGGIPAIEILGRLLALAILSIMIALMLEILGSSADRLKKKHGVLHHGHANT